MPTLSVLIEDTASDPKFACEHGLSLFLEHGDSVILFDVGETGACIGNAARMGCDLSRVTDIVLSHGHHDHCNGLARTLRHMKKESPPVLCHPDLLVCRHKIIDGVRKDVGVEPESRAELADWSVRFSREPVFLRDDVIYLGEIERTRPDLCPTTGLIDGPDGPESDPQYDDTALAYITSKGLVVIAGCSHSGIVNIVEQARRLSGVNRVHGVYGGLHCRGMNEHMLRETRTYLDGLDLMELWGGHCCDGALNDHPVSITLGSGSVHRILV